MRVGAIGCVMRVYDVPLVPAVLGLVLGPLSEQQFRRALAISEGDLSVFVSRPISAVLLAVAVAVLLGPTAPEAMAGARCTSSGSMTSSSSAAATPACARR